MHFFLFVFSIATLLEIVFANPFPQSDLEPPPFDDTVSGDSENVVSPSDLTNLAQIQIDSEPGVPANFISDGQDTSSGISGTDQTVSDLGGQLNTVSDSQGISTFDSDFLVASNSRSDNPCEIDPQTGHALKRGIEGTCGLRENVFPDGYTDGVESGRKKKPVTPDPSVGDEENNPNNKPETDGSNQIRPDADNSPLQSKRRRHCPKVKLLHAKFDKHLCCGGPKGPKIGTVSTRAVYAWFRRCIPGLLLLSRFIKRKFPRYCL